MDVKGCVFNLRVTPDTQKLYTEDWDEEKTAFFPYSDSPELRRVAKAQEVLSDVRVEHIFNLCLTRSHGMELYFLQIRRDY